MKLQTFFTELQSLLEKYPKIPATIINSEDCDYGNKIYFSKNLSFCFDTANCTDGTYLYDCYMSPNCSDCDYCVESELCYESVDAYKCFNGNYVENCGRSQDIWYSYNCINCHDVFGCVDLQNKSLCIFNRQLTEKEYRQKIELYKKWPAEKGLELVEELKTVYPVAQTNEAHNENSEYGNYIAFSKNCYMCFDAGHNEDSCYLYDSFYNKMCYDTTYAAQNNQLSYEVVDSANLFNCNYAVYSSKCNDSSYIFNCSNLKDSLGCVGLSNKQYCVLNRQLTKEEYERIKNDFLLQLKQEKTGWNSLQFTS